jgi:putative ABC transport system ATP-binding protein
MSTSFGSPSFGAGRNGHTAGPAQSLATGQAGIVADNLVKTYQLGGNIIRALDGVSLNVRAGEMIAIRGPSGSGKSTLMNILGCLERADAGRYVLAGEDVSTLSKDQLAEIRNRRIGFVFQTFNLLPRMTALENVELPIHYSGAHDAVERATQSLEIVGLADRMKHEPNKLSGGQRQRVAIARALVTNPAIVLADEPTGALDSRTGAEILSLFKELNSKGQTIIIVTHDLAVARHCQREIYLRDGKITHPPTLDELTVAGAEGVGGSGAHP